MCIYVHVYTCVYVCVYINMYVYVCGWPVVNVWRIPVNGRIPDTEQSSQIINVESGNWGTSSFTLQHLFHNSVLWSDTLV